MAGSAITASAAPKTRPWSSGAVRRCISVSNPTAKYALPTPAMIAPGMTVGSTATATRANPIANAPSPAAARPVSPRRRIAAPAVRPPAIAPTPWIVARMPRNAGGRCSPWSTTSKKATSVRPTMIMTMQTTVTIRRSSGVAQMCRTPAVSSSTNDVRSCVGTRSGERTSQSRHADARKVAASNAATAGPPQSAKSPAPTNGAAIRTPWPADARTPFASPRRSSGSIETSNPARAAYVTTLDTPYRRATAKMIQTSSRPPTRTSDITAAALSRSFTIMTRRRGNRSISIPKSGETSAGTPIARNTEPARALDPVRDFTQIASTIIRAKSPNCVRVCPIASRR